MTCSLVSVVRILSLFFVFLMLFLFCSYFRGIQVFLVLLALSFGILCCYCYLLTCSLVSVVRILSLFFCIADVIFILLLFWGYLSLFGFVIPLFWYFTVFFSVLTLLLFCFLVLVVLTSILFYYLLVLMIYRYYYFHAYCTWKTVYSICLIYFYFLILYSSERLN